MGRILAVDDDALSRAVLADLLRALRHEATVVSSAAEALLHLDAGAWDLVLSDVILPGIDGIELARRCAARRPPVPVALVSARRPDLSGVPTAGFLAKPLDADRLGRFLDTFLGARRAIGGETESWSGVEFLAKVAGPVERFPPARVLFLAHRVSASGALRIERGGSALIGLRAGKVVQVSGVPGLLASLGGGIPDGRDLATDVAAAVSHGHPPDRALQAAAEGLGAWLGGLVDATGGHVAFDASWLAPAGAFPLPEPVPRLLARGLVRARPDALVARVWGALGGASARARLPDDAPDSTWGLDATSTRIVRLAQRPHAVERILALASPLAERATPAVVAARNAEVLRALDTLRALGLLVVDGGAIEAPAGPAATRRVEATQEDPRVDRLSRALAEMEAQHPLEVLDLAARRRVTEEDIANAYREISRRYHPDHHFNAPPAVRGLAEACFGRVNAAYDALRVPGGLAEAKRFLEARARGEAYVSEKDHLAARVAFRRAEQLFRAKDYTGADPLFHEAARLDPLTWPHALYAAWCGWLAKRLSNGEAVAALDAVKTPDPLRAAEALVMAGTILKQDNRPNDAFERFRAALAKDPNNRDAQREIRLHELRNPPKPPPPFAGLLNRRKD